MEKVYKENYIINKITEKPPDQNTSFPEETGHDIFEKELVLASEMKDYASEISKLNEDNTTAKVIESQNVVDLTDSYKAISAADIINSLFLSSEDLHIRIIDDKKRSFFPPQNIVCKCGDYHHLEPKLQKYNQQGRGVFFVVNSGGNNDKSINRITAQFVEMDSGSFAEQQKKIDEFPLPPSFVIQTRRSLHVYWIMDTTAEIDKFRLIQQMLVRHFSGDPTCVNLSRVMRLPGFNHCKKDPIPVVCIDFHPERIYSQDQIIASIPESERVSDKKKEDSIKRDEEGLEVVLAGCEFIKHCAIDAATLSEPEWYAMITNLIPFRGGVNAVHELSKPYPGYSKEITDNKISHFLSSNTGPMTCKDM